uniref:Cytochrome c-552/4 domain-containing protein n=1 Tax=Solibacter usitatus (strain Ellin6076) TaxID=234267 RepID=Q01YI8_SOLUE
MRVALIVLAVSGLAWAQPASHAYIGAGGCASSNCHGGTTAAPVAESRILANEYATWSVSDKHTRAYKALEEARGKRMAEILGITDATRDKRCTVCHAVGSPEKARSDGVACEACHGPAEAWLGSHTRPNSHEASVKAGMTDTKRLDIRAGTCLACHLGAPGQEVDHELIAAGHPDLAFELDTFTAAQPAHHRPKPANMRQSAWAVGETAGLAHAMRLVQAHEKSWPEFSDLECYQCHHDLRSDSWRIQRGYPGRKPGALQFNTARLEMVRALVAASAPDQRAAFEAAAARLNAASPGASAKAMERIADSLTERFQKQDIDAAAVLKQVTANIERIAGAGVGAAEQATMTLDALGGRPDATTPLYNYLEHPSMYRPAEFAAIFQKAAANQ